MMTSNLTCKIAGYDDQPDECGGKSQGESGSRVLPVASRSGKITIFLPLRWRAEGTKIPSNPASRHPRPMAWVQDSSPLA